MVEPDLHVARVWQAIVERPGDDLVDFLAACHESISSNLSISSRLIRVSCSALIVPRPVGCVDLPKEDEFVGCERPVLSDFLHYDPGMRVSGDVDDLGFVLFEMVRPPIAFFYFGVFHHPTPKLNSFCPVTGCHQSIACAIR